MNERTLTQQPETTISAFTPARSGILQRKCACGQHTHAGDKCADGGWDGAWVDGRWDVAARAWGDIQLTGEGDLVRLRRQIGRAVYGGLGK